VASVWGLPGAYVNETPQMGRSDAHQTSVIGLYAICNMAD